ncbi:hypothetical protein RAA17_12020 [Komagataeibacter rhaeticus]|nr:hypothetical protein [Komagataeibacter rhaeticus]
METVCVSLPTLYDNLKDFSRAQVFPVSLRSANGTDIELVRRTDMEAQVARVAAEKDAEIARLRAKQPLYDRVVHENGELKLAVARLQAQDDKDITQVIEERDECEQVISDLYRAAMGEYPEWSNNFGYRDAVEDVVDYVHALRTKALNEGAAG